MGSIPAISTVNIIKTVTKAVEDFRNTQDEFIGEFVAPSFNSKSKTGKMPRFTRAHQKNVSGKVSPTAPSPQIEYGIGTTAYECEVYRHALPLPTELAVFDDTDMLNAQNLGIMAAEVNDIERETEIATMLIDTSNSVTAQSAPSTRWDATGGDPAGDVATAIATIKTNINRFPRYGLMTTDVWLYLATHVAAFRAGGGNSKVASLDEIAGFLNLAEVRVMAASYDSAAPGDTSVGAPIMAANKFWVFHKPAQVGMFVPSWASTPTYRGLTKNRVWTIDDPEGLMIEDRVCRDLVVADKGACVYIATPLT